MFKGLKKRGEDTPLDHIPEMDFSHNWFMNAYSILCNSCNENGRIPLSELKIFEESFGLIGSFREFTKIMYQINDVYSEFRRRDEERSKLKLGK